jgi:hypothetical protein
LPQPNLKNPLLENLPLEKVEPKIHKNPHLENLPLEKVEPKIHKNL